MGPGEREREREDQGRLRIGRPVPPWWGRQVPHDWCQHLKELG